MQLPSTFKKCLTILVCSFCYLASSISQTQAPILFKPEVKVFEKNISQFIQIPISEEKIVDGHFYKLIQFESIPKASKQELLASNGIILEEYIPSYAYLAKFPITLNKQILEEAEIVVVKDFASQYKIDHRILNGQVPEYAFNNNKISISIISMKDLKIRSYISEMDGLGINAFKFGADERFAYANVSALQIQELAKEPWLRFIEIIDPVGEPESTEGRTVQKANTINNQLSGPGALSYNATGVGVLVRDDGIVGPHIDYHGRLNNLTSDATGTHGDGVGGVMAGGGILDPTAEAGGSGADVWVIDYQASFQDNTLALHLNNGVMITNSSYSNGCNAGYTSTTSFVDNMVFTNQNLMHTFSGGNSNNNNCGYGAGNQWGNITGGHKVGKNVMAVANLFNDADLVNSSSRGPAHDGRIKPDIAAHGQGQISTSPDNQYQSFGGTSAAAPSMAGNMAQLYEAYKDLNGGNNAPSALLKAAILNSATDLGNVGPDFKFGWGLINTGRAYEIIGNNQYLSGNITQGNSNTHTVSVPTGVGELRVMVYWHDRPGTVNTSMALVNDIDMTLTASGLTYQPLVLDPTPNPTTLNLPAVPGVDHLNNMEQVRISNPSAGNYIVNLDGFAIPQGPQEYFLVYTFIMDEIKVTYPMGGEGLVPNRSEFIHWDAYGTSGNFNVSYSVNNGSSWLLIASNLPGDTRLVSWNVPNNISENALVRVTRGNQSDQSDENFTIINKPNISVDALSFNSASVSFNAIPGATNYDLYVLGDTEMEFNQNSTSNSFILSGLNDGDDLWLAVAANINDGKGERSLAVNYVHAPSSGCGGCIVPITSFPASESFEGDFGNFCNYFGDDLNWIINSGGTASDNTGPPSAVDGSSYLYIEASGDNYPDKTARLLSPCLDLSPYNFAELDFYYHMFGGDMGELVLDISTNGGVNWTNIWSKSGNQGNSWKNELIDITPFIESNTIFRFVGTTGDGFTSDIALDLIKVNADNDGGCSTFDILFESRSNHCYGENSGLIAAAPTGGQSPFTYLWNTGATTDLITNLFAGTYTLTITDANGCPSVNSQVILEGPELFANIITSDATNGNNGTASSIPTGGHASPYTFQWSNGETSDMISDLAPGLYDVTITDRKECDYVFDFEIFEDAVTCDTINFESFETGFGDWMNGGGDCFRREFAANSGAYSLVIRDNNQTSVLTSIDFDLSALDDDLNLEFSFLSKGMAVGHGFFFEISTDGGNTFTVVSEWNYSTDFVNNQRKNESVTIQGPFTSTTNFRFRCDGFNNTDRIFIDDINIFTCPAESNEASRIVVKDIITDNLQDVNSEINLSIYPNPNNGSFILTFESSKQQNGFIEIYDIMGKEIFQKENEVQIGENVIPIDIAVVPGYYIVQLNLKEKILSKKIIIE